MEGPPLLPGYTIGRRLGSAESNQWFAIEDATGRPVTLRLIPSPQPAVRERLHAGISLMSAIEHVHIVPLIEAVDAPDGVIVKCGAAEGGSLGDALGQRGTLTPGEVVTACAPIADALGEVHPHGIMHGAITVDDIVFTLDGRPMLAGMGMAQLGVAPPSNLTPIAPEIAAGSPPSPSSDVYCLAAVAVIGLTGHLPRLPLQLPSVPPASLAVLSRALERAPERRPDAAMLSNALFTIASPEPVEIIASTDATGGIPVVKPSPEFTDPSSLDGRPDTDDDAEDERVATFMRGEPIAPDDTASGRRRTRRAGSGRRNRDRPAGDESMHGASSPADDSWHGDQTAHGDASRRGDQPQRGDRPGVAGQMSPVGAAAPVIGPPATDEDTKTTKPVDTEGPRSRRGESRRRNSGGRRSADEPRDRGGRSERVNRAEATDHGERVATAQRGRGGSAEEETARTRREPPEGGPRTGGFDYIKLSVVLVVILVGVGVYVLVDQFRNGDGGLPSAEMASPSGSASVTDDLCGGPRPAPTEAPPEVGDWTAEIQRLYTLRAQAFTELDPELLCQVYSPTSTSLAVDVERLRGYSEAGVHADGLTIEVIDVEMVDENSGVARVRITDRIPPYELVGGDGEVVSSEEGKESQTWVADLVAVSEEEGQTPTWRFS